MFEIIRCIIHPYRLAPRVASQGRNKMTPKPMDTTLNDVITNTDKYKGIIMCLMAGSKKKLLTLILSQLLKIEKY